MKGDGRCGESADAPVWPSGRVFCHAPAKHNGGHVSYEHGKPAWTWVRGAQRATRVIER